MQLQPSCSDFKGSYSIWLLSPKFSTKGGSKVWHHITQFWKVMASTVAYFSLWISEEILQHNIWLRMNTKVYTLALLREGFLPCIGKDWGTFGIFGIMEGMNFWNGRLTKLNSPLLEFTMTFGLSYWSSTNLFKRGCLANKVLNLLHMSGLASLGTQRMHCPNGWSTPTTSRNLALAMFILARSSWAFSWKSIVGLQYFTLTAVKAIPPMAFSSWMARVNVDNLTRGSNQTQFILFFGELDQSFFDHVHW